MSELTVLRNVPPGLLAELALLRQGEPGRLLHRVGEDQQQRWRAGQRLGAEVYCQAVPELRENAEHLVGLIHGEYRLREELGESPSPEAYLVRFPEQAAALRFHFTLNGLLSQHSRQHETLPLEEKAPGHREVVPPGPLPGPFTHDNPGTLHGYTLLHRLGRGAFGEVWQAQAPGGMPAAVKIIHCSPSEAQAHLELQALESIRSLTHFHLLKTQAYWVDPDQVVIAMELADGTLRQRLQACQHEGLAGIPVGELLHYLRESAEALDYLHQHGKLHRDVKPDNIMLFNGVPPHVKLGDCGLLRDQVEAYQTMTTLGTPPYIAPEVWERRTIPQSDQYSLAVTYVELRQGRRPFRAVDTLGWLGAHVLREPDLGGLVPEEQEVVQRALSKEATERFPACLQMVEELERVLGIQPGSFRPGAPVALATREVEQPKLPAARNPMLRSIDVPTRDFEYLARPPLPPEVGTPGALFPDERPSPRRMESVTEPQRTPWRSGQSNEECNAPQGKAGTTLPLRNWLVSVLWVLMLVAMVVGGTAWWLGPNGPESPDGRQTRTHEPGQPDPGTNQKAAKASPPSPIPPVIEKNRPRQITNSIGVKLTLIPAGTFQMGSPVEEKDRDQDEQQHEVEITQAFYLSVYEVTQGQYRQVKGSNPAHFSKGGQGCKEVATMNTDDFPVENVSWAEAVAFCNKLSQLPQERKAGRVYRLPREAEWEYACRAGTTTAFHTGRTLFATRQANFDRALGRTCVVGSYPANAWGLHDMHGNVAEWCADWYDPGYYGTSPRNDPTGSQTGKQQVVRGGSWLSGERSCRSAARGSGGPTVASSGVGFRVVCVVSGAD